MTGHRAVFTATFFGFLGAVACHAASDAGNSGDQSVTNIPQSSVIDQGQSGNCWLYTTAAWIESLHAARTGDSSLHLSPAYWHYWDLYEQIVNDEVTARRGQVQFGGYWSQAADLVARYGMMKLGAFAQDDAVASVNAVNAVNAALGAGGALAAPGAHQNRALVLKTLNAAFRLPADLATKLANTFGPDGTRTFDVGAQPADGSILSPHGFDVWTVRAGSGPVPAALDQILGTRGALVGVSPRYFARVGPLAWNATWPGVPAAAPAPGQYKRMPQGPAPSATDDGGYAYDAGDTYDAGYAYDAGYGDDAGSFSGNDASAPTTPAVPDMTSFYRRMQRALNDGAPLPFAWFVSFGSVDGAGRFHESAAYVNASSTGAHETLVTDYEVVDVPGYGTLPVGFSASEAQKQAALEGNITFFRTKNSWGTTPSGWLAPLAGYNDLDTAYLTGPLPICPDPSPAADGGAALGTVEVSTCVTYAPLVIDVALPPGY